MIRQIATWLGPTRVRLLIGSLVVTGIASLLLAAFVKEEWSLVAQTILMLVFLSIATLTVGGKLPPESRRRLFFTIGPALGLAALSILLPNLRAILIGGAFGWLLAAQFFIRDRIRMEYKTAIKHMRKEEYRQAIDVISALIEKEPKKTEHVLFRARLNQVAGHSAAAIKDYEKVVRLEPTQPDGYNGLSEIYLQKGDYGQARHFAQEAYQRQPDFWVAPYNLGMIEDRLQKSESVVEHINAVLEQGLPDSRHRLLSYLWLARAQYRLGNLTEADAALDNLKHETRGMKEWQVILKNDQATTLRNEFEGDIQLAQRAIEEEVNAAALFGDSGA